jgi:hypothetical protein
MGLQSSIFHRKDHAQALAATDIIVADTDFPATVRCPFCGENALNIYEDAAKTDLWLTCTHCPAHGNIITFAGSYWKIDTLTTVDKFKELGVPTRELSHDAITATLKRARDDTAAEKFWAQAASQLWAYNTDLLALKFRDFGLSPEIPCDGLAGVALPEQVAELCRNIGPAYPKRLRNKFPVLVFPYCDLPRHYSGFLLIQYLAEFETRRIFLQIEPQHNLFTKTEAGYYFLENAVLAKNAAINNAVFVVDDPQWVLKAQTIQLRHGDGFLPICASYSGKDLTNSGGAWPTITRSRKFFYSSRITPELISQAANARGYICPIRADGLPKSTQPAKTIKTLGQLYRAAVTWQKTLTHVLEKTNDIAGHSFASRLIIPAEKLRNFFANNPVVPQETAESILAKITPVYFTSTETTQYSTAVVCKDDGWYTGKNSLITNCTPVIEKIVHTDDNKYYIGYVKKKDLQVPFQEEAKQLEGLGLLAYAERLLAAHGEHVLFVPPWNRRSHITAMTLRPPEIVHVRSRPGWDDTTKEFYCGGYAINTDGLVRALPANVVDKSRALNLPEPGVFAPPSLYDLLTPAPESSATWLIVAAGVANMLADAFEQSPQGVCVTAPAFFNAREILQTINCARQEVKTMAQQLNNVFAARVSDIYWPELLFANSDTDRYTNLALVKYPNKPAIIRILPETICTALSYGWQVLAPTPITPGRDYAAIPHVVAGYLQHAMKNRPKFVRLRGENLTLAVLRDLHNWLAETYNSAFNLAQAENNLFLPGTETTHLMREINNAILANEIDVLPAARKQRQACNYIVRDQETWWLNRKAIDDYIKKISGTTPNWGAIADCFAKQGLLRGEKTIHKTNGLLVERNWCDKFWTNYTDVAEKNIG